MTEKNRNLIITLIIVLLVALVVVFIYINKKDKQLTVMPDITYIYTEADFPDTDVFPSELPRLVDKLNKDYSYLRDNVDFSHYDIWVDIGNVKQALNDGQGAVEAWQYATTINNLSPLAFANIANYYKSFARDYERAEYYYGLVMERDNIGYYFDYEAYADLYRNYLPENPSRVESIMLLGVDKASPDRKLEFYRYLYFYFEEKNDKAKMETYKNFILGIDPNYQF